jgi:hypothetical protein
MRTRLCSVAALLALAGAVQAQPVTFTKWDFQNYTTNTTLVNNPIPSVGIGSATQLGMTNTYVLANGATCSTANGGIVAALDNTNSSDGGNAWRVRGASGVPGSTCSGNGWSLSAPQFTQGAEFRVNAANYTNLVLTLDWFTTTQGVRHAQLQYSVDAGQTWISKGPILSGGQNLWTNNLTYDFSSDAGVNNNPDFRVRLVSVHSPTYTGPGAPTYTQAANDANVYGNSAGNWRFDAVAFTGTPVGPVPPSVVASVDRGAVCNTGGSVVFTAQVFPGAAPSSTGLSVSADLSSLNLPSSQPLFDNGTNGDALAGDGVFTFAATAPAGVSLGVKSIPLTVSDAQLRTGTSSVSVTVGDCSQNSASRVVISQVFAAGGNVNINTGQAAPFDADFVELFNRSAQPVDLTGWSLQYASASSAAGFADPTNRVALSGQILPGQALLVRMSTPAPGFPALPTPDFDIGVGLGGMDGTDGRIALVRQSALLGAACSDAIVEDLVGYGRAACFEGVAAAGATSTTTGLVRKLGGAQDTTQNFHDLSVGPVVTPRNRSSGGFLAGYFSVGESTVCTGGTLLISGTLSNAGATPVVTADVSAIAGSPASVTLAFNQTTQRYEGSYAVPAGALQGLRAVPVTVVSGASSDTSTLSVAIADCSQNSASRVVISQVFPGGGNDAAGFNADFVEIFNRSGQSVNLTGWTMQYADSDAVGGMTTRVVNLSGVMAPYTFRLIRTNNLSAQGAAVPDADFVASPVFGMDNNFGRIAIVRSSSPVGDAMAGGDIEDYVGYGAPTEFFEGVSPVPTLTNITTALRKNSGFQDNNQNGADFVVVQTAGTPAPTPRNSATPPATPATVVCCRGSTCATVPAAQCSVPAGPVVGLSVSPAAACGVTNSAAAGCCFADFNKAGGVTIDDIFIYLNAWFATSEYANVGTPGAPNIDDIFIFLNAWFAGC